MKTGVQIPRNYLNRLDSGFRRNDKKQYFSTFYELITFGEIEITKNMFDLKIAIAEFAEDARKRVLHSTCVRVVPDDAADSVKSAIPKGEQFQEIPVEIGITHRVFGPNSVQ